MSERIITVTHSDRIFGRTVTVTETGPISETHDISQHVRSTLNEEIERAKPAARTAHDLATSGKFRAIELTDGRQGWIDPVSNPDPEERAVS